jgi:hypothetical protein
MITHAMDTLGRRVLANKHFRWMQGMKTQLGVVAKVRQFSPPSAEPWLSIAGEYDTWCGSPREMLVDPSDPATKGCLLQIIREVCDHPGLVPVYDVISKAWSMHFPIRMASNRFTQWESVDKKPSEEEVLIEALDMIAVYRTQGQE